MLGVPSSLSPIRGASLQQDAHVSAPTPGAGTPVRRERGRNRRADGGVGRVWVDDRRRSLDVGREGWTDGQVGRGMEG